MSSHKIPTSPVVDEPTAPPPVSELPPDEPPPRAASVVPAPEAAAGGLDNIPEELLSAAERAQDELDHAGLDAVLPGEDQAHEARTGRT
jgi:hypothetical protein